MHSQSEKKPKVTSSVISQHLLRSYHYFYSRTFPEFFTCEKKCWTDRTSVLTYTETAV